MFNHFIKLIMLALITQIINCQCPFLSGKQIDAIIGDNPHESANQETEALDDQTCPNVNVNKDRPRPPRPKEIPIHPSELPRYHVGDPIYKHSWFKLMKINCDLNQQESKQIIQ